MDTEISFGTWVKRRRKSLDLTQHHLAQRVFCSLTTIQKIEAETRRPSSQLAELLANALEVTVEERPCFLKFARGEGWLVKTWPTEEGRLLAIPTPSVRQNNLPILAPKFIGREAELNELKQLISLPDCNLLTLTGLGGVGKTYLAVTIAAACTDLFAHGVCFVPLGPLNAPEYITSAIINGLRLTTSGPADTETQLLNFLREKEILLVLDNLEHLLSDIHVLVDIIQSAPRVKILATSRERLNLKGERVYDLRGLPAPLPGQVGEIEENSAVQLFLCTAQHQNFSFMITEENREAVVRICNLVDGIPLGLELAAAWTNVLSCQEIASEIEGNLDFLADSARDRSERHRSIRAVFDHSWRLLTVDEQRVLRQLSVFRGGCGREAVEQAAGATLPVLSALINKSLLHRTETGRYDLHELIRQYSVEKLIEAHEEAATQERHFNYYLSLSETAASHFTTVQRGAWLERLEAEHDNLRTALDWSQVQTESREPMLRLAGALNGYWEHRGDLSEGRFWLENALRDADGSEAINIRARAFFGAGRLANDQGDKAGARPLLERSAGLWRACGDSGKNGLAYALCYLGGVVRELGDVPQAHSLLTESVALFKAQDDPWGLAFALVYLGMVLRDETDYTGARLLMEESHALWREIGEPWGIALVLHHLGLVALRQGDYEGAQNWCEESLLLRKRLGNKQDIAYSLHTVGVVVLNQGRILPAKPYMQYSQTLFGELGDKYGLASTLSYLGYIELFDGDEIRAQYLFEKSLALAREGGPKWLIALPLARLAGLAALRGRVVQAIMLWEAVEAHMDACNSYLDNGDRIYYERLIAPACAALSEQTVAAARADGRKMTLEETIQLALKATQLE